MIIGFDGSRSFVDGKTGTENYSYQILKSLSLIDTKNQYLVYLRPGQNQGKDWPDNFKFKTLNFKFLWTQAGLSITTFFDTLDILFVPAHTLPILRKPGLKTIVTVHDLGAEYLPLTHQLKQTLYLKFMTHYQLKTASRIISVSKATKNDIVKKVGLSPEKIEVIYEGVDKNVFRKISNDIVSNILSKYKLKKNKYFLFVGTIQPRKNLIRLISAFKKFLDLNINYQAGVHTKSSIINHKSLFRLVLVGQNGWKSDRIYKLPAELGIERNISFLPSYGDLGIRISDDDLAVLYNGAVALCYPSLFEGFGLPILEAMACGCPVITSDTSSMPEVAGGAGLLVNPLKVEEIAQAMLKITKDDSFRNILIKKGMVRCGQFSWEKAAADTLKVIEQTGSNR